MKIIDKVNQLHELILLSSSLADDYISIRTPIDTEIVKRYLNGGKWCNLHIQAHHKSTGTNEISVIPWLGSNYWPSGYTMPYMESVINYPKISDYFIGSDIDLLNQYRSYCEEYKANWSLIQDTILPMYQLFGGNTGFEYFKDLVLNDSNWPASDEIDDKELFRRNKKTSLYFDPSPQNQLLWELIEKFENDSYIPPIPNIDLGIYEERIFSSITNRAYLRGFDVEFEKIEGHLLLAVYYSHGFGTENSDLRAQAGATETSLEVFYPIKFMFDPLNKEKISEKTRSTPEFYIAEMMNEKQKSYNGMAHFEVATLMDEKFNDPKKAWKYLKAAGYWVGKNMPEAQGTVLAAAMHLCEKHGWKEALEVLEYNKKIMES
ncbi:MAG: hypothetical protein V4604_03350 [Bacteroidota bacterium]